MRKKRRDKKEEGKFGQESKEPQRDRQEPGSVAQNGPLREAAGGVGLASPADRPAVRRLQVWARNTQSMAVVPKGTNPVCSRSASYPVFKRRLFTFRTMKAKDSILLPDYIFPNSKFRICGPVTDVLWVLQQEYMKVSTPQKIQDICGHLHILSRDIRKKNLEKFPGVWWPLLFAFSHSASLSRALPCCVCRALGETQAPGHSHPGAQEVLSERFLLFLEEWQGSGSTRQHYLEVWRQDWLSRSKSSDTNSGC